MTAATPRASKPLAGGPVYFALAFLFAISLLSPGHAATTVLHFSVSEADAATVAAGTVPGVDGSPDGSVAGTLSLSEDIPTEGAPAGGGDRSLAFTNTQVITIPGTQQLSHAAVIAEGGFTFETWFKWNGAGNLNAMIDYAGTEKFRMIASSGVLDMNFDSGSGAQVLANPTANEWHYIAAVFEHDGEPVDANLRISGTLTWYYDGIEVTGTAAATKDDFGDSLNRTIGVGGHPLGFGADFVNGLMYEPRVSLGALSPDELLYDSGGTGLRITGILYDEDNDEFTLTWTSKVGKTYGVFWSPDCVDWGADVNDFVPSAGGETTSIGPFPNPNSGFDIFFRVEEL